MRQPAEILTAQRMEQWYGSFYESTPKLTLDRARVPRLFWPLMPYAEFWGIADDLSRENLVMSAPLEIQSNLKQVVAMFDRSLDDWLAGPESGGPTFSEEYVAFSAMRMAADYI